MAVYLTKPEDKNLKITVEEDHKRGEVRLVYNGHPFVICRTNEDGKHLVEVKDADTGVMLSKDINLMCWMR